MAPLNISENRMENPSTPDSSPTASTTTKWRSAKVALGSVIMLASLVRAAISLAWAKMPTITYLGPYSFPLYGLPYPILSLLWQSAEFFKAARNNKDTGFSAASHLICDLLLGVVGLVLAIAFAVIFQLVTDGINEDLGYYFDGEFTSTDLEILSAILTLDQWMSTAYMWSGMARVAALSHFLISMVSYFEIRLRYRNLEKQSRPALDAAPPYLEPSSKPLLTVGQVPAAHQVPSEVLAHNEPQEFGDSNRAVEMPGADPDEMGISVVFVGVIRRSNDQDSLQQDT